MPPRTHLFILYILHLFCEKRCFQEEILSPSSQEACAYRGQERLSIFGAGLAWILESRPVQLGIQRPLGPAMFYLSSHTANLYIAHSYGPAYAMTLCEVPQTQMSQGPSWHSQVTDRGGWPSNYTWDSVRLEKSGCAQGGLG